jgi:hypothetical protein
VPLSGITWPLIEEALAAPDAVLEARIAGVARDGGPVCATVPLLDGGWHIAKARLDKAPRPSDPKLQEIVLGLRELIQDVVPEVTETVNPWGIPTFELNGPMCYFMVAAKHITFGFPRGTSLTDSHGLLEGTGKDMRHVKLRNVEDLRREGLRELVAEAVHLNRETPAKRMGKS